ncbi:MAG: radical SAM protein [Candidatus Aminicenantes bacterium]|nr:radical SAM protein [Candidatus Aminicenantes bacterium]
MKEHEAANYDILFLHPPSSFNKTKFPLSGPFPSGAAENDLFLYAPVGINALYHKLKSQGFNPGVLNIGRLYYNTIKRGDKFDLTKIIADLQAKGFGIDLHWAVHTPGALEMAAAIKKLMPDSFVFLGGLTATYFFREILKDYPYIDAVVLGEADEAIVPLAETLKRNSSNRYSHLKKIPNLAYRSRKDGPISVNPARVPEKWEDVSFRNIEKELSRGYISIKGCNLDCPFCGGSKSSYKNFYYRECPLALDPEQLIREIETFEKDGMDIVFLMGDIRILGKGYVDSFLKELRERKLAIHIQQELFYPAKAEYLERWKNTAVACSFNFELESVDNNVLRRIGREYTEKDIRDLIKTFGSLEIPLALLFLFPLPGQDAASIYSTLDFIEQAVDYPHISFLFDPLFFVSPGSPIFENPGKWGYQNEFRTIKDFRKHLEKPHWSQSIGHSTQWLSKEEIIDMIFYVSERSSRIRLKQNPDYAPLYLLNIENLGLNRKLIKKIRSKESISDEYVENLINRIFPHYLLKDNFMPKNRISKADGIPYFIFPYLSYLLIQVFNVSPHRLISYFKKWFENTDTLPEKISLEMFKKVDGAPDSLKKEMLDMTVGLNIDPVFIDNLMDFEWLNELASRVNIDKNIKENKQSNKINSGDYSKYKLILNKSVVIKTFKFNFDRIDWINFINREPLVPKTTYYLYSLQNGRSKAISPFALELLNLCDGKRYITEIIKELKKIDQKKEIAIAMTLGKLASEGILIPQL